MKTEGDLVKSLMVCASDNGARLFRNNVGNAWVGKTVYHRGGEILLQNVRPLHAGLCIGSGDLIGWTPRVITQDMVGKTFAIFTSVECKSNTGRLRPEQAVWIENVNRAGGIAILARKIETYMEAIRGQN